MAYFRFAIFIIFGVAIQQLVHNLVEIWYIGLLLRDFSKFGFGLSWETWFMIHHVGSFVLLILGIYGGYRMGRKYVRIQSV